MILHNDEASIRNFVIECLPRGVPAAERDRIIAKIWDESRRVCLAACDVEYRTQQLLYGELSEEDKRNSQHRMFCAPGISMMLRVARADSVDRPLGTTQFLYIDDRGLLNVRDYYINETRSLRRYIGTRCYWPDVNHSGFSDDENDEMLLRKAKRQRRRAAQKSKPGRRVKRVVVTS